MAGKVPNRYLPPTGGPLNPAQKPVGYGLKGTPFYNIEKYHQSEAFREKQARKQLLGNGPHPPYNGGNPPRRGAGGGTIAPGPGGLRPPRGGGLGGISIATGNRLGGVRPTFPHPGAPAAPGTADQHVEALRLAMVRAQEGGLR